MAGTFFWVVYPASGTDPANTSTGADFIAAGQDGAGVTATDSGSIADSGQASPITDSAAGLTAGTSYRVAWAWKDGSTYPATDYVVIGSFKTIFTSSGALSAQSAEVDGTAAHYTLHTASGALEAQAATVSGAAVHPHIATGALEAQAAVVAGSAAHYTLHTSTGELVSGAATVSGAASLTAGGTFSATGALSADSAEVEGTATHYTLHSSTGALDAQSAQVAGTAVHYTLHTATGDLVAGSAGVSGAAVDETTFVPPKPNTGAGKSRKPRKRRIQVEVDGEVFDVASQEEAEAVLEKVAKDAEAVAKVAVERASKAKKRPVRKILSDARRALQVPQISVPHDLRDVAQQLIGRIQSEYQSALSAIEIAAHMARREREIEEDDEEIFMLL